MKFVVCNDYRTEYLLEIDLAPTAVVSELKKYIAVAARRGSGKIKLKLGNNKELLDDEPIGKNLDRDKSWIVYLCFTYGEKNLDIDLPTAAAKDIIIEHGSLISILSREPQLPSFFIYSLSLSDLSDFFVADQVYVGILIYGRCSSECVTYGQKVRPGLFVVKNLHSREMKSFIRYREREGDFSNFFQLVYQWAFATNSVPDDLVAEGFFYENGRYDWNYEAFPMRADAYEEPKIEIQQSYRLCLERFLNLAWKTKEICSEIKLDDFLEDCMDPLHLGRYFKNKSLLKSQPNSLRSSFTSTTTYTTTNSSSSASSSLTPSPRKSFLLPSSIISSTLSVATSSSSTSPSPRKASILPKIEACPTCAAASLSSRSNSSSSLSPSPRKSITTLPPIAAAREAVQEKLAFEEIIAFIK